MNSILIILIVGLLIAIFWGVLRRGLQRVIGFVLLALLAMFAMIQGSGESSVTSNLFDGVQEVEPLSADTAFDNFTQTIAPDMQSWVAAHTHGVGTPPDIGEGEGFGSADAPGDLDLGSGTAVNNADTEMSEEPSEADSQGAVRAWW